MCKLLCDCFISAVHFFIFHLFSFLFCFLLPNNFSFCILKTPPFGEREKREREREETRTSQRDGKKRRAESVFLSSISSSFSSFPFFSRCIGFKRTRTEFFKEGELEKRNIHIYILFPRESDIKSIRRCAHRNK